MMEHDDVYKAWCSTKHEKHNIKHDVNVQKVAFTFYWLRW